jgi:predicted CopG family antitoxin
MEVISLSDEAYKILKKLKGENESLSDVIMRLVGGLERKPLSDFYGNWIGDDREGFQRYSTRKGKGLGRGSSGPLVCLDTGITVGLLRGMRGRSLLTSSHELYQISL